MAEGWFRDPYGRHDARWFSGGFATALVRDGTIEGNDPPPEQASTAPLVRVEDPASAPTFASDLLRADDAERLPPPTPEEYGTVAFDTMARPGLWHPGQEKDDYDTRPAARRRLRGAILATLGALMLAWGFYLIIAQPVPTVPTRHFNPSPSDSDVLRTGGTAVPPTCSDAYAVPSNGLGFTVGPSSADTQYTLYPNTLMSVQDLNQTPEFSASAPVCELEGDVFGAYSDTTYMLERPGRFTMYFVQGARVSTVRIVVAASNPSSSSPYTPLGWALIVIGGLTLIVGAALAYRRASDRSPLNYSVMRTR